MMFLNVMIIVVDFDVANVMMVVVDLMFVVLEAV
jgi:hypothetical protein